MTVSEFAEQQVEFLTRRLSVFGAISPEQEQDLALARTYLRLREAVRKYDRYHVRFEHRMGLVTPDSLPFYAVRKVYRDEFLEVLEEADVQSD